MKKENWTVLLHSLRYWTTWCCASFCFAGPVLYWKASAITFNWGEFVAVCVLSLALGLTFSWYIARAERKIDAHWRKHPKAWHAFGDAARVAASEAMLLGAGISFIIIMASSLPGSTSPLPWIIPLLGLGSFLMGAWFSRKRRSFDLESTALRSLLLAAIVLRIVARPAQYELQFVATCVALATVVILLVMFQFSGRQQTA